MYVIEAKDVDDALLQGTELLLKDGILKESRAGDTIEVPYSVATVYTNPHRKVIFSPIRDANPFFHFMESLWILAGREDVKFLTEFNKRMVEFSDNGETFNAPYGYRLRNQGEDQIAKVINELKNKPNTRQAVCQIWDANDLGKTTNDKACNLCVLFRIRNNKLDMTVYNRSNDMLWGAYGANVVQFSILQEYVAAHINKQLGTYTQVSNSFHVYLGGAGGKLWNRVSNNTDKILKNPYATCNHGHLQYINSAEITAFDDDLEFFFSMYDDHCLEGILDFNCWGSYYFAYIVIPMLKTYLMYKQQGVTHDVFQQCTNIGTIDWYIACHGWLKIRKEKKENARAK